MDARPDVASVLADIRAGSEAEGHVCAAGKTEMVLVIVADARANIGLIRMEMLKALERVTE